MRLIDADELKKCAIPCQINNGALTELCVPLYQIDNAPTVEVTKPQYYCMGFADGLAAQNYEKPPMFERPIRCKDCKHQTKDWHENKRMKEGGYLVYGCDFIADPFVSASVNGEPDEYCSSAEPKGGAE